MRRSSGLPARLLCLGPLMLLVAIALVLPAAAQAGPLTPITPIFPPFGLPPVTASLPATITGVVQTVTGAPIASATVEVFGSTVSSAIEAQSFSQRAVTGADGRFVITDVIEGTYSLTVNSPDASPSVAGFREEFPWNEGDGAAIPDTRHYVVGGTTVDLGTIALKHNGVVNGRAMDGPQPVSSSEVTAHITDPVTGRTYVRWATTGIDGRFSILNAPPGDWSISYAASGQFLPSDPVPTNNAAYTDYAPMCQSAEETFTVAENETVNRPNHSFTTGRLVTLGNWEQSPSDSFNVGGMWATLTRDGSGEVYSGSIADDGWLRVYMPAGSYTLVYTDPAMMPDGSTSAACYATTTPEPVTIAASPSALGLRRQLTPLPNTSAITGHISESGGDANIQSWVSATIVDPSSYAYPFRRTISNGTGYSDYLIRVPKTTGYSGNQVRVQIDDYTDVFGGTTMHYPPTDVAASFAVNASSDTTHDVAVSIGGSISGIVHDESGAPVQGVTVSARRKAFDPSLGAVVWMDSLTPNSSPWVTMTDGSGHYTIGGLPSSGDYKVSFNPDYNPGWPLDAKYREYNRRLYNNRQLADGLDNLTAPPVPDHDPVSVTLGSGTGSIDTTIVPGGWVALHADGPEHPTGAVYCDVMYNVSGDWTEVDSGFTTGGTFQKMWKVLPTGSYRLDYSDYFGRGTGSWTFNLAAHEHKNASILVPAPLVGPILPTSVTAAASAPVTPMIVSLTPNLSGAFLGEINGGLVNGGTGGLVLSAQQLSAMPSVAGALPRNVIPAGGAYSFASAGATANGVWTLTMPYNAAVPDGDAGSLVLQHLKQDATVEMLTPVSWNTAKHTVQVQTASLGTFQVAFQKKKVTLGKPTASTSKPKHTKAFTVYGSLAPKHSAGAKSVQLRFYTYSKSKRRWVLSKSVWAKNVNYRGGTRYSVSVKLKAGAYRVYAYAPTDAWHLATTSSYRAITVK